MMPDMGDRIFINNFRRRSMKRLGIALSFLITLLNPVLAQSEAGAIFLLIAPGARAGGMGEAQVAVANDAYAS